MATFATELLDQLCVDAGPDAHACLETLSKLLVNTIREPANAKFRRVRPGNAILARTVFAFPQAELLLASFGFVETAAEGETVFVLPEGVVGDASLLRAVMKRTLESKPVGEVVDAPAPAHDEGAAGRHAALEASKARRAAEEKERVRQRALIEEDKLARAARTEATVVRASIAAPRLGHGSATTYGDVGVDLNRSKGG